MSFVLDALRKQEAQRNPDAAAALSLTSTRERRQRLWIGLFVAALLGNLLLLGWLFGAADGIGLPGDAPAAVTPTTPPTLAPEAEIRPPPDDVPAAVAAAPTRRVTLAALPTDVRRRFPGLVFSTHVYAEDPTLRAVVANGRRLQQGDRLGALEVAEITEGGVVLGFEDYLVEVPVVTTWDVP